jgi:hypothetical protein
MNMVWDRHVSNGIRELGYDVATQTMAVVFSGGVTKYHAPVPYPTYAAIFHATFPERLYKQTVGDQIPIVRR